MLLNNGCLCCSVRGDLVDMLGRLVTEKKGQFDHILIETTGLANPAPIIQTFYLEPDLLDTLRLDGVVTLVDAKHAMLHLDEKKPEGVVNEALEQVAFADRLVLNKTDLVNQSELLSIENRVRTINNLASIQRAEKANVDLDFVLGVGGFDLDRVEVHHGMLCVHEGDDAVKAQRVQQVGLQIKGLNDGSRILSLIHI